MDGLRISDLRFINVCHIGNDYLAITSHYPIAIALRIKPIKKPISRADARASFALRGAFLKNSDKFRLNDARLKDSTKWLSRLQPNKLNLV